MRAGLAPCQAEQGAVASPQDGVRSQRADSALHPQPHGTWGFGCGNGGLCVQVLSEPFGSANIRIYLLSGLDRTCGMCNYVLPLGKYSVINDYYFALCLSAGVAVFRL